MDRINRAIQHEQLGDRMYDRGRYKAAVRCYKRSLEASPTINDSTRWLAAALEALGRNKEAEALFEEAAADGDGIRAALGIAGPGRGRVRYMTMMSIGRRLENAGRYRRAAEHYAEASRSDASDPSAYCARALVLSRTGRGAEALEDLARAAKLEASTEPDPVMSVMRMAGEMPPGAACCRAYVLAGMGRYAEAEAAAEAAMEGASDHGDIHRVLHVRALIQERHGRYAEAARLARESFEANQRHHEPAYLAADCLMMLGRDGEADEISRRGGEAELERNRLRIDSAYGGGDTEFYFEDIPGPPMPRDLPMD